MQRTTIGGLVDLVLKCTKAIDGRLPGTNRTHIVVQGLAGFVG